MPPDAETTGPIRVLLVDDHRIVRRGVIAYLEVVADIAVVGEAADGADALDRLARLERQGELPDVVLMDMKMPVMDGITATRQIKSSWPVVEVVAMTSFVEEAMVRDALEAGAAGYLLKDADADEVAQAIRTAHAGQMHLDPTIARLLADSLRRPRPAADGRVPQPGHPAGRGEPGGRGRGRPVAEALRREGWCGPQGLELETQPLLHEAALLGGPQLLLVAGPVGGLLQARPGAEAGEAVGCSAQPVSRGGVSFVADSHRSGLTTRDLAWSTACRAGRR